MKCRATAAPLVIPAARVRASRRRRARARRRPPKDSSAGAIASFGLMKLHLLTGDPRHRETAQRLLRAQVERCANRASPGGLLLHATADLSHGLGIDASTMYGDYYYLKSLLRLGNLDL